MLVSLLTILGRLLSEQPYDSWSDRALIQVHGSSMDRQIYLVLASVQFVLSAVDLPAQISLLPSIPIIGFIRLNKHPSVYR
jgi:hypothetical protein